MTTRISAFASPELLAVLVAMQGADKEIAKRIRQETKANAQPIWQAEVGRRVVSPLEAKVLGATARVAVSNQNVTLKSATIGRALSGGAKPSQIAKSVEFGSKHRQFKSRVRGGYVVYPAVAKAIPRLAALWVQTVARTLHEAAEGKS